MKRDESYFFAVLSIFFLLLFSMAALVPVIAFGGERCSQFSGICRDACAENEMSEEGDFLDCAEKELCCTQKEAPKKAVIKCCVLSFDSRASGPSNCVRPEGERCSKGTPSPAECETIRFCINQP
jgi:hypothetical protein